MATTPDNDRTMTTNDADQRTSTATGEPRMSTADFAGTRSDRQPVERKGMDQSSAERQAALFPGTEAETFHARWSEIQASFVDEPRSAVKQADSLVAEVMQRLAQVFADERSRLEGQWDRGEDADTEAQRQALRRYRSFFDRLLSL